VHFKGRLLGEITQWGANYVIVDRLGSASGASGAYYPYGENAGGAPMEPGGEGFATYYEDWYGQNYADQRYYNSIGGRFLTPDPGGIRTADAKNPTSWNRYAYTNDDPVNFNDAAGLFACAVGGMPCDIYAFLVSMYWPNLTYPLSPAAVAASYNDAHQSSSQALKSAFDKVSSALRNAANASGDLSEHLLDCWAGEESSFDPNATSPGGTHKGLFQLNQAAWTASGINAPFTNGNAYNPVTNATAAVDYLNYLLATYVVGTSAYEAGTIEPGDIAEALDDYRYGPNASNKQTDYGDAIMSCVKDLDNNDWTDAMRALGIL
jgi:RHS repeat-associated protein